MDEEPMTAGGGYLIGSEINRKEVTSAARSYDL